LSEVIDVIIDTKIFLPKYKHLLDSPYDIDWLWGGRDSGKSYFVACILVTACLHSKYFRCVLARKVFNTIKDSQWQTIKDVTERWGISHLFTFRVAPLEIHCINGNKFICRGFDEPGKLKSISNPSHAWVEEGNQIDQDDFIVLMTSLRYNGGRVKTWVTFNPESPVEFADFWIYKLIFEPYEDKNIYSVFNHVWDIPVGDGSVQFTYQCTHSTYHDNKYCRPERAALLEYMGTLDPYYYQVFTRGKWGNRKVDDAFCYTYDPAIHKKPCTLKKGLEVVLSFDFNVNPITCGVYQSWLQPNGRKKINCVESIQLPNSDIYKLCDHIELKYKGSLYRVTGDATGKNTSALVQDGINYYTVIKQILNLSANQLKVPTVNPPITENRVLVNASFKQCDVSLDPVNSKHLIYDCENVSVNDMGKIDKGDRANPRKRADALDHYRYYLNTFHKDILKVA
jgi:phage terminase large subunit